jgi:hypothetical protein
VACEKCGFVSKLIVVPVTLKTDWRHHDNWMKTAHRENRNNRDRLITEPLMERNTRNMLTDSRGLESKKIYDCRKGILS